MYSRNVFFLSLIVFGIEKVISFSTLSRPSCRQKILSKTSSLHVSFGVDDNEQLSEDDNEEFTDNSSVTTQDKNGLEMNLLLAQATMVAIGVFAAYSIAMFAVDTTVNFAGNIGHAIGDEFSREAINVLHFCASIFGTVAAASWEGLKVAAPYVGKGAMAAGQAAAPYVEAASQKVAEAATPIVQDAAQAVSNAASPIVQDATQAVTNAATPILQDAATALGSTINSATDTFTSTLDMTIVTPIKDATDSVTNAVDSSIKDATVGVTNTIQGVASEAAASIKDIVPF